MKPDKFFLLKLGIAIDTGLITPQSYMEWSDKLLLKLEEPPYWIIELSMMTEPKKACNLVHKYAFSEPFEDFSNISPGDLRIACLYIMFEQGTISWEGFLLKAGGEAEAQCCKLVCEDLYLIRKDFMKNKSEELALKQQSEVIKIYSEQIKIMDEFLKDFNSV